MTEQPYAASQRAKRTRPTGLPKSSRREYSPGRRAWYAVLIFLARGVVGLLAATCRRQPVRGGEHLDRLQADGSAAILAYWHQMQVFCGRLLLERARAGLPVTFLTSPSVSGEVPAAIIRRWGGGVLRGSSKRSAGQALKDMYEVLVIRRNSLVITPDGPTGPLHEFKPGTIMLARMTKAPIILVAYAAKPCIRWNSWDRFILPLPFARVAVAVSEPYRVPAGVGVDDLGVVRAELEARMARLVAEAEAAVGNAAPPA
ncbi:MAG: lysophospholipid acyltransferase family protein [Gammaproteobacteria bacterium]|nr:lysophospholipid acyltransferase family protein [Gammaproteobacteria bacterium]